VALQFLLGNLLKAALVGQNTVNGSSTRQNVLTEGSAVFYSGQLVFGVDLFGIYGSVQNGFFFEGITFLSTTVYHLRFLVVFFHHLLSFFCRNNDGIGAYKNSCYLPYKG